MELIPKQKIEEAAKEYSFFTHGDDELFEIDRFQSNVDFKHGANFAINEMPPLSCEFVKWVINESNYAHISDDKWEYNYDIATIKTTQQLFDLWVAGRQQKSPQLPNGG